MLAYRHEPECKRAFADFYWRILLYIASIITLAALAFGIWELSAVLEDWGAADAGAAASVKPVPALNKTQLQDTLEKFQSRARHFESLRASPPEIADPSR